MSVLKLSYLAGDEGFESPSATPKLHLSKRVLKSRFPCKLPQAIFTPILMVGCSRHSSSKKAPTKADAFLLAGDEGFEPPILGPEPSALPLGQSPSFVKV
jgi:hypothetical protein